MKIEVFKIHRLVDSLYSTGGYDPRWTKRGKTWSTMPAVKNHLRVALDKLLKPTDCYGQTKEESIRKYKSAGFVYKDCVLRTFTESGVKDSPIIDLLNDMKCKGYGQDESQTVLAKLIELYGLNFV